MRFFALALLAVAVQSIKITDRLSNGVAITRDMQLLQTTLGITGPEDLVAALKAAVSDDKELTLPQFKEIIVNWLTKEHGAKAVAAHKAEIDNMVAQAFKHVDADGSGTITAKELEDALSHDG